MDFPTQRIGAAITIVLLVFDTDCSPVEPLDPRAIPRKRYDTAGAVDLVHAFLPKQMPIEDRCIRYAMLSDVVKAKRMVPREDLVHLLSLDEESLNNRYRQLDPLKDLTPFYMAAIDSYRATQLRPPMLDIVECLKLIDTDPARLYLNNTELIVILDLYRKVLESPETIIDLSEYHVLSNSPFRLSLEALFEANSVKSAISHPPTRINETSVPLNEASSSCVRSTHVPIEQRLEFTRHTKREYQRRVRREQPYRHRESARLRKQRSRLLEPEMMREKDRISRKRSRLTGSSINRNLALKGDSGES